MHVHGVNTYNHHKLRPKHSVNCHTSDVVYILNCPFGAFDIRKTKINFWRRIKEHIQATASGEIHSSLGRHNIYLHNYHVPNYSSGLLMLWSQIPEEVVGENSFYKKRPYGFFFYNDYLCLLYMLDVFRHSAPLFFLLHLCVQ